MLGLGNILSKGGVIQKFPNEYSFNFDGSNDYLELPAMSPTGTQSIAFWFKTSVLHGGPIYTNVDATSNFTSIAIYDGKLQVTLADTQNSSPARETTNTYNDNNWHHAVVVREDTSTCSAIYIDGALATTNTSLTWYGTNSQDEHSIGHAKQGTYNYYFNGLIDEVAVWSTDIGASVVAKIGSKPVDLTKYSASNLKLWLRAGDKVLPESTTSIARADFTAEFDGGSDEIRIKDYTGMSVGGSDHTITGWIKFNALNSDSGYTGIIYNGQSRSSHGHVGINPTNYLIGGTGGGDAATWVTHQSSIDAGRFTTTGTWHHIAQVRIGNTLNLYKDGILVSSGSHSYTPHALDEEPAIGSGGGAEYFNGAVSHVGIFKTGLPANDIALMAKSRFTPTRDYMLKQVDFDGSNDYIDCGNDSSLQFSGSFSIGCWFKTTDASSTNEILVSKSDDGVSAGWLIRLNSSRKLDFSYVNSASGGVGVTISDTGSVVNDGQWYHVMFVHESGVGNRAYKDGALVNSNSTGTDLGSHSPNFHIGNQDHSTPRALACSVSAVGAYSDAKDADFIYAQYSKGLFGDWSADTNLVGYWKMGNGTGDVYPTIVDQSSNSNNGTMTSMTSDDVVQNMVAGYDLGSYNTSSVATTVDYLEFDSTDYIDCGTAIGSSLGDSYGNDLTISAWFKLASTGTSRGIFEIGAFTGAHGQINVWYSSVDSLMYRLNGGAWTRSVTFTDLGWNHVAIIYDASSESNSKLYLNGSSVGSTSGTFPSSLDLDGLKSIIGAIESSSYNWEGGIKSVGLYNVAKSEAEIQAIYNAGIDSSEVSNSGIINYWQLNNSLTVIDLVGSSNGTPSGTLSLGSYYRDGNYLISPVEDTKTAVIDVSNPVLSTEVNTSANASSPSNEADATTGWTTSSATISSVAEAYTSSYSLKVVTSVDNGYALVSSAWTVDNDSTYKLSITWKTDGTQTNEWRYGWGTSGASAQYGSTEVNGSTDWVTSVEYIKTTSTSLHLFVQERNSTSNALALYIDSISIKKVQGNIGKPTSMDATNFPYTSVLPDQSFFTGVNSPYNFIDLDGSDEYIVLGGSSPDTAFSISAWVFDTHASGSDYSAIYASNSTAIWFGVQNNSNGSVRLHINGNSNYADTPSGSFSSPSNQWIHLVGTWDGTNAKIYINEESQTLSVTGTLANPTANANPTIGTNDNSVGLNQWTGKIGQTALWNRGLLDTEVSAIYKLGRHGNLLDSYSDNLVGYWAMGALDALTGLSDVGNGTIYDRSGESNHGTATNTESADLQSPPNAEPEGYDIESTTRTTTTP